MKKITKLSLLGSVVTSLMIAGCFVIMSVNQPSTIMGLEQFTASLVVSVEGISDTNPHYAIIGLMIPNDWTVDSVYYTGGYSNACAYLPPDVPDNEPGGQVDFWTDSLESNFPSGADMKWVVYQSLTNHPVLEDTVDVDLFVTMTPGVTQGTFDLGYFTTDAALDFSDPSFYSVSLNNTITVSGISDVNDYTVPGEFYLSQNYPNPFNPATSFTYSLKQPGDVQITVYDAAGKEVKTLVNGFRAAGSYTVSFEAENLVSGIYYYRIITADFTQTNKMILLK